MSDKKKREKIVVSAVSMTEDFDIFSSFNPEGEKTERKIERDEFGFEVGSVGSAYMALLTAGKSVTKTMFLNACGLPVNAPEGSEDETKSESAWKNACLARRLRWKELQAKAAKALAANDKAAKKAAMDEAKKIEIVSALRKYFGQSVSMLATVWEEKAKAAKAENNEKAIATLAVFVREKLPEKKAKKDETPESN